MNNILTAKEYLDQLKILNEMIDQNIERLNDMKIQATCTGSIRYDKERVQTSPTGDTLCRSVSKYVDFEDEINAEIDNFVEAKAKIIREIRGLRKHAYIQVLFKVYVQFKSLKVAASEMNKSYSYVVELHSKALEAFEETYKNLSYLY